VSFFSPVVIPRLQKQGRGLTSILDFRDFPEIETNLVNEVSIVRPAA
jgi:hypothetical protein